MGLRFLIILAGFLGTTTVSGQYLPERDLNFGDAGQVVIDVDALDHCAAVTTDSLGNTWFCGRTGTVTNGIEYDYVAGKLLPDGTLDTSFGNQGIMRGDFAGYTSSEFVDMALVSDGLVLLGNGGHHSGTDSQSVYVMKIDLDGVPDANFATAGLYEGRYRGMLNEGHCLTALDDGNILLAGATYDSAYSHKETGFIGRLLANGIVDTTFGGSGILTWDGLNGLQSAIATGPSIARHSDGSTFLDIAVTPWGDYFAVGYYDTGLETKNLVARFHPNGTLISDFAYGGVFTFDAVPGESQQISTCTMIGDELAMGMFVSNESRFVLQTVDSSGLLSAVTYPELTGTIGRVYDLYAEDSTLFFCGEARESSNSTAGYTSDYFTLGALNHSLQSDTSFTASSFFTDHFGTSDEAGSHAIAGGKFGLVLAGQLNADFTTGNYEDFGFIRLQRKPELSVDVSESFEQTAPLSAYPNPASSHVNVRLPENSRAVKLLNMQGQVVRNHTVNTEQTITLDLSGLPAGIYFLQSQSPAGIESKQIVKVGV